MTLLSSLFLLLPSLAWSHSYNVADCFLVKEGRVWYVGVAGGGAREIPAGQTNQVIASGDSSGGGCAAVTGTEDPGRVVGSLVSVQGEGVQWTRPCRYAGNVRSEGKVERSLGFGEFLTLPFEGSGDSARIAVYLASPEEKAASPSWADLACLKAAKSLNGGN